MSKTIKNKVKFGASPMTIYQLLMDSKKHGAFTGVKASIDKRVGGKFAAYGCLNGINVELKPGKRIVQAWREHSFPEGVYSIVTFELKPVRGGCTELTFTQYGVPTVHYAHINAGWREQYWEKIKAYLLRDNP
jgi:activator of HSP90 ATPase